MIAATYSTISCPRAPLRAPCQRFAADLLTRVLLVFDVFLPELFFQLGIGFLLGGLAQAPRHDVIVTAIRNRGRRGARALRAAAAVVAVLAVFALPVLLGLQVAGTALAVAILRAFRL